MQLPPALRDRLAPFVERIQRTRGGRFAVDTARGAVAVAHGFRGERIALRASALTYISIFQLVPMLAVALALVEAIGAHEFNRQLRTFVFDVLAPGIREDSAAYLDRFLHKASTAMAGTVGFVVLALSAGSLLRHLDTSINEIWNVRRKRPFVIRVAIYALVLLVGPVLLALSLSGVGLLQRLVRVWLPFPNELLTAFGAIVAVVGFTLLYLIAPNAKVRFRSAIAGGLVAGLAWDVAKHGYGEIAARLFKVSPIWGSISALPLFLTWIYVSWLLLLFGARLAYAVQFAWFRSGVPDLVAFPRSDALVAARLACVLSRIHLAGGPPASLGSLAEELKMSVNDLESVVDRLVRGGVVRLVPGGEVEPARPLDKLTLADAALAVGGAEVTPTGPTPEAPPPPGVEGVFTQAEEEFLSRLRRIRWLDLPELDQRARIQAPTGAVPTPAGPAEQKP